tara:strand:- start:2321 stop:3235 length:915 start_codon:yes stop_codon:yes gene_type:complete
MKKAGIIHKEMKEYINKYIKLDMNLYNLAINIENKINDLVTYDINNPLDRGVAFPTGISVNNCAAHWTPYRDNKKVVKKSDVIKIDFGIHINGSIIDSAFTFSFDNKYNKLLDSSKTSTDIAIKLARPDMLLSEIGNEIEENMRSYEIELNGKIKKIVPVKNLCGHEINRFEIHGSKVIPIIKCPFYNERIKEGEYYAVETFASTGKGDTYEDNRNNSHYMIDYKNKKSCESDLYKYIMKNYNTLAFTDRWFDGNINNKDLNDLCERDIVKKYPPIYDIDKKSYIAQFEESIYVGNKRTEILSN